MPTFPKFEQEQTRNGQKASLFDPNTNVISADLYNDLVMRYNRMLAEYNEATYMYEDLCD